MKSFKEMFYENRSDEEVHRIDGENISDFSSSMRTYHHTPDWGQSWPASGRAPKGHKKSTGLFAGEAHTAAQYSVPKATKYTQHWDDKGSVLTFDQKDKEKIQKHRPVLSTFKKSRFKRLDTGEHFSENPGQPVRQTTIKNPIRFMQQQGHRVQFVSNIEDHKKSLEKNNIHHDSQGL